MKWTIDSERRVLTTETGEIPLYSAEAFEILSREWVRVGWALKYYHTFTWMGRPMLQLPEDMMRLQEVFYEVRPDVILETGINEGGSLVFHASICEALGQGRVIGVDIAIPAETREAIAAHRLAGRIRMLEGDSAAPSTVASVRSLVGTGERVLVILDSHHSRAHVRAELEAYSSLVSPGSCIIATDGIMRDLTDVPNGDASWISDNPAAAAADFLAAHPEFELRHPSWNTPVTPIRRGTTYWPDAWLWRRQPAQR